MNSCNSIPLIYALHSGNLYGTERMALATAAGLAGQFRPMIMAPPGPALEETARLGFDGVPFSGPLQFAAALRRLMSGPKSVVFLATGVMHSSIYLALNRIYRRCTSHLHLVHGGAQEGLSYGRKKKLNGRPVRFVAVSNYVRDRLLANGVNAGQISVIENFLPDLQINTAPQRAPFHKPGIRRVIVISRLDPEKRVDVLLDALDRHPALRAFEFRVFGSGWNAETLRQRATAANLPVEFAGFTSKIPEELAASDLLLHLCPTEPFGLAILEAMAARLPVLAPDGGGAGSLVTNEKSGFHFYANDPDHLAERLLYIHALGTTRLNQVICESQRSLRTRFSEQTGISEYRRLILEGMS